MSSRQPLVDLPFFVVLFGLSNTVPFIPMTLDMSHWAPFPGFAPFLVVAALALSEFYAALGSRRLLHDDLPA